MKKKKAGRAFLWSGIALVLLAVGFVWYARHPVWAPVSRRPDSLWPVPVGNCCNVCSLGHFPQKRTNSLMFVISAFRQCRGAEIIIVIKQKFFSFRQKTATIEKSIHLH